MRLKCWLATSLFGLSLLGCVPVLAMAKPVSDDAIQQQFNAATAAENAGDMTGALRMWTALAEQGVPEAQYNLGIYYSKGKGVAKDDAKAALWFGKAADQGIAEAQLNLAVQYSDGLGVRQDYVASYKWVSLAIVNATNDEVRNHATHARDTLSTGMTAAQIAEAKRQAALASPKFAATEAGANASAGSAPTTTELTVTQQGAAAYAAAAAGNFKEALRLWMPLAEGGDASSQVNVGMSYERGEGVAKDQVAAVTWYRKAAEQGNSTGQLSLAQAYKEGNGLKQDDVQAAQWYQKAADQGLFLAQLGLGLAYAEGKGVPQDNVAGYKWAGLAVKSADDAESRDMAKQIVAYLAAHMKPAEIAAAKSQVEAWKPAS